MAEQDTTITNDTVEVPTEDVVAVADVLPAAPAEDTKSSRGGNDRGGRFSKNRRESRARRPQRERVRPEFDQKMISIRRVARVTSGGRRFSFSVALVAGDRRGRVGVGLGKAGDTSLAIEKALRAAKKSMVTVPLTDSKSIPHDVTGKYASARIMMRPAPGRGLVAGSAARTVLELAGVTDVSAKILSGSKNRLTNAMAALSALKNFRS
jgi:small subunit ribosomal protein S5